MFIVSDDLYNRYLLMLDKRGSFNAAKYKLYKSDESEQLLELCYNSYKNFAYYIKHRLSEIPKCPVCETPLKKFAIGQITCSTKCRGKNPSTLEKRKQTCIEHFGVDNPVKSKQVRDKIEQTNLEKYGVKVPIQNKEIYNKLKSTMLEKYGVESNTQIKEVQEKIKNSMLKRYGTEHAMQSDIVKQKRNKTCLEKYGVDNPFKVKEIREKAEQTNLEKYGVKNVAQSEEIQDKIKAINLEKYGSECYFTSDEGKKRRESVLIEKYGVKAPIQNKEIREKIKNTNLEKYGSECTLGSKRIREKIKNTNLEKYGYENIFQTNEFIEKRKQTYIEHFGVDNPVKSKEIQEKIKVINLEKYGSECTLGSKQIREKIKNTNLEKYGYENVMQSEEIKNKVFDTKRKNHTFNSSKPEDLAYVKLFEYFPEIIRQYKESRYPFNCDFYVPINDLFIELNYFWTHGSEPYNKNKIEHIEKLNEYKEKSKKSDFFNNAIIVWTQSDPFKRKIAFDNHLNYKAFYNQTEFNNWIKNLHPLSYYDNLDVVYSDEAMLKEYKQIQEAVPSYTSIPSKNMIIKNFQTGFYQQEKSAWKNQNVRKRLIQNRIKYIGKGLGELSKTDILYGFKASRISEPGKQYTPYSHFSQQWMRKFIQDYDIKSIYDPCGGWGHRLTACSIDFPYWYNDINQETVENSKRISNFLGMKNKIFTCSDAAENIPDKNYDAIFTCPPYWNIEMYSDKGIENYSYAEFLEWWNKVVLNYKQVNPRIFGLVMRSDYSKDMCSIIKNNGFEFVSEHILGCDNMELHFNRSNNKTRKHEILSVFRKI